MLITAYPKLDYIRHTDGFALFRAVSGLFGEARRSRPNRSDPLVVEEFDEVWTGLLGKERCSLRSRINQP